VPRVDLLRGLPRRPAASRHIAAAVPAGRCPKGLSVRPPLIASPSCAGDPSSATSATTASDGQPAAGQARARPSEGAAGARDRKADSVANSRRKGTTAAGSADLLKEGIALAVNLTLRNAISNLRQDID